MLAHIGSREKKTCKENDTTVNIVNGTKGSSQPEGHCFNIKHIFTSTFFFVKTFGPFLYMHTISNRREQNKHNKTGNPPCKKCILDFLHLFLLNLSVENALTSIQNKFSRTLLLADTMWNRWVRYNSYFLLNFSEPVQTAYLLNAK